MNEPQHPLHRYCLGALESLVSATQGMRSAAILTGDGFEVATVMRDEVSPARFAAMASSLLALSDAVAGELVGHRCRDVIVETGSGSLVTLRIPSERHELLISVLCSDLASLGAVLFATRDAARTIASGLPES